MDEMVLRQRIESKIYFIRGQKVMLDSDLAELYGVKTKELNKAVKRNKERNRKLEVPNWNLKLGWT